MLDIDLTPKQQRLLRNSTCRRGMSIELSGSSVFPRGMPMHPSYCQKLHSTFSTTQPRHRSDIWTQKKTPSCIDQFERQLNISPIGMGGPMAL